MRVCASVCALLSASALLVAGCGSRRDAFGNAVGRYCNYGAKSEAQYDACVDHVTYDDVVRAYHRDSEAAIYALDCDGVSGAYSGAANVPKCEISSDP